MAPKEFETDLHQYTELRTILDSLDTGALRYYLNAATLEEQKENFDYLQKELTPIIKQIWAPANNKNVLDAAMDNTGCPDGYVDCYGVCVPYNCLW